MEFTPRIIGNPDVKTRNEIFSNADVVLSFANSLHEDLSILFSEGDVTLNDVMGFINAKDPLRWLKEKYVSLNGICIPGIKTERLIDQDMIEVPDKIFEVVLSGRETILEYAGKVPAQFNILSFLLYDESLDKLVFADELSNMIIAHTQVCTENEIQNEILDQMELICGAFNHLVEMEAISISIGVESAFKGLARAFKHNRFKDMPNQLDPQMFNRSIFLKGVKRFRSSLL